MSICFKFTNRNIEEVGTCTADTHSKVSSVRPSSETNRKLIKMSILKSLLGLQEFLSFDVFVRQCRHY